jgi:hypothetical protein
VDGEDTNLRDGARNDETPLCKILTPTRRTNAALFCCKTYFTLVPGIVSEQSSVKLSESISKYLIFGRLPVTVELLASNHSVMSLGSMQNKLGIDLDR